MAFPVANGCPRSIRACLVALHVENALLPLSLAANRRLPFAGLILPLAILCHFSDASRLIRPSSGEPLLIKIMVCT